MSSGYRKELDKYEEVDEDELLAALSPEELRELERELDSIDPDESLPLGHRQKSATNKAPTGNYSRKGLLTYWEKETKKMLEEEHLPASLLDGQNSEDDDDSYDAVDNRKQEEKPTMALKQDNQAQEPQAPNLEDQRAADEDSSDKDGSDDDDDDDDDDEGVASEQTSEEEEFVKPHVKAPVQQASAPAKTADPTPERKQAAAPPKPSVAKKAAPLPASEAPGSSGSNGNPTVAEEALERVRDNDPETTEVNLNNVDNVTAETMIEFAQALRSNGTVRSFSLANTRADDRVAIALGAMLAENESITSLNIESNYVSGKGILAIIKALQVNRTLTELRFHNQRHILGGKAEMEIAKVLRENDTLLKLGYHFELGGPRMTVTGILSRNMDKQRQRRLQEQKQGQQQQQKQQQDNSASPKPVNKHLNIASPKSSPLPSPKTSPCPSPLVAKKEVKSAAQKTEVRVPATPRVAPPAAPPAAPPPPPPPPPPPLPAQQQQQKVQAKPTRKIAEIIKEQDKSKKGKKSKTEEGGSNKSRHPRNGESKQLVSLKGSLRPVSKTVEKKQQQDDSRPATPQANSHDQLMDAIKCSTIKQLKKVEVPKLLQ